MSFIAPLFLLALAGLALPWLLHRLQQHQAEVVLFPSIKFMESTRSNSSRRRRLRYKGLMALRMLALLALCLLFAEPFLESQEDGLSEPTMLHWVVLDRSYSMRFGTRWERAVRLAEKTLADAGSGNFVQLLTAGRTLNIESSQSSAAEVIGSLGALSPGNERLEYTNLVQQLDALAEEQSLPVIAHIITDAQNSAMPVNLGALNSANLSHLQVHRVDTETDWNLAVYASAEWTGNETAALSATVNYSSRKVEAPAELVRDVAVKVGTDIIARESISIQPNQSQTVNFDQLVLRNRGSTEAFQLEVSLMQPQASEAGISANHSDRQKQVDALSLDDIARVPLPVADLATVYLLSDDIPFHQLDNVYVQTALEEKRGITVLDVKDSGSAIRNNADIVILFSAASDAELPESVARFLHSGGKVFQILSSQLSSNGDQAVSADLVADTIAQVNQAHPLLLDENGWAEVSLYGNSSIDQSSVPMQATTLLTTNTGQIVLFEAPIVDTPVGDEGRHLVLGLPLDGVSNDLPLSPVFVPFLHHIVDYFLKNQAYPVAVSVGDVLRLAKSAQVIDPGGETLFDIAGTQTRKSLSLDTVGLYTVIDRSGESSVRVSVDAPESDVQGVEDELLSAWQSRVGLGNARSETMALGAELDSEPQAKLDGFFIVPLWPWLLPLLVVLGLFEIVYANWVLGRFRGGI